MVAISLTVPVQVDIVTVRIACAIDDYMSFDLKDAQGATLATREEEAPDFLAETLRAGGRLALAVEVASGIIAGWTTPDRDALERDMPGGGAAVRLAIFSKVRDEFTYQLLDAAGAVVAEQREGYVPGFMPGDHYGDYVMLEIDLATGRIVDWAESCTPRALQEAADGQDVERFWPART